MGNTHERESERFPLELKLSEHFSYLLCTDYDRFSLKDQAHWHIKRLIAPSRCQSDSGVDERPEYVAARSR